MQQNYNEKSIQHQFDAYCKKVLRNEITSIRKRNTRIKENEELFPVSRICEFTCIMFYLHVF